MARYWSTNHCHPYHWGLVVSTYWKRYPNPQSQHVFSEDIISSKIEPDGSLRTLRLIVKTNSLPTWGEKLFSTRRVFLIEESIVDPKSQCMRIYTRNLNLRVFMGTTERMTILPSEENQTNIVKEVWIESDIYGLRNAIKSFGIERFKKNCEKATQGFEWVLQRACSK